MRTIRRYVLAATLGSALLASPASAEFANWFCPPPTSDCNTFTIVIKGDQRSYIGAQNAADKATDPFASVSGTPSVTVAFDGTNTKVTYTGGTVTPTTTFPVNKNGKPHFGLNGAGSQPPGGFKVLSETWSNTTIPANHSTVPSLTVFSNQPTTGATQYLNIFVQATGGGQTAGQWFETPYQTGQTPMLGFTNYSSDPLTLSNVGFFLSPTQIPLDQLNFDSTPPPGQPGSMYTPVPGLDGMSLAAGDGMGTPGGSADMMVPEPGSLVLLGAGLLGLAACGAFRLARSRPAPHVREDTE